MKLVVISHPDCLLHETGLGHPESPERLHAIIKKLNISAPTDNDLLLAPITAIDRRHLSKLKN